MAKTSSKTKKSFDEKKVQRDTLGRFAPKFNPDAKPKAKAKKPKKAKTPFDPLVNKGEVLLGENHKRVLDKLAASRTQSILQARRDKAHKDLYELVAKNEARGMNRMDATHEALKTPKGRKFMKAEARLYDETKRVDALGAEVMADARSKLISSSTLSETSARRLAETHEYSGLSAREQAHTRRAVTEFHRLTNGSTKDNLKTLTRDDDRAYAVGSKINIGKQPDSDRLKAVVFHEMGHIHEDTRGLADTSMAWVKSRATSDQPMKLKDITGAPYRDSEVAYPGKFINPYVGKVYPFKASEVISMGVEAFVSPRAMWDFYRKDPEHFLYSLGALRDG